ncbi:MAG: hypothetical protein EXS49_02140 [Candidatus Pacebacteria bacterium]|nr:hypothetical protein [Candidatus Paceibacterota bacterium]
MIDIIFGEDSYRRNSQIKEIASDFIKKNKTGQVISVSLENDENIQKFNDLIKSTSLFQNKRLIILKNIEELESIKDIKESLKSIIDNKNEYAVIEFNKKPTKEFDFLIKGAENKEEFSKLNIKEFKLFLEKEAKLNNLKVTKANIEEVAEIFEGKTFEAMMELERISLGEKSDTKTIIPEFFPLIQKLKNGRSVSEKIVTLEYLLINNDSAKIFNILSSLMGPKTKPIMADYDIAVKSGKLEYDEAILYYCLT